MSNDELTKQAIRTSADLLELNEKVDDIRNVQDEHTARLAKIDGRLAKIDGRFDGIDDRFDKIEGRLDAHIARSEDHFRQTDANFIELRGMLATLISRD